MIYTKGHPAANFFAFLALVSSFILGLFANNIAWLLLSAVLVALAWWTRKYKATGATATPYEFIVSLVMCAVLYGVGYGIGKITGF